MLVVEDDRTTRDLLRAIFTRKGWKVAVAATVADGLAKLDPAPDFLILDITLPDGEGTDILRQIREARLPTRVAVATALNPDSLPAVRRMSPEAFLQKPIDVTEMCRACGV